MENIKKILLFRIPMSICNLRCHYCYLSQREKCFQGIQPEMKYSPEEVAKALSVKRIGGLAYMNFCADGETLLTKDIDKYVNALVKEGHYAEVVTNLTSTKVLELFLTWEKELLKRLEFKCSFHYLELKRKGLLEVFADNVKKVWEAGASATIELAPSDELVPYIEEIKQFSMKHFGALPHLTILRDDRTSKIERLTSMSDDQYNSVWSQFDSDFWNYKNSIFGVKQKKFCYAGMWSLYIDLSTGDATPCYFGQSVGDIFQDPNTPLPTKPVGKCELAHCYNGHAFLTLGLIPNCTLMGYGDIRNRVKEDGTEWLQPELKNFFNTKCINSNPKYSKWKQLSLFIMKRIYKMMNLLK